MDQLTGRADISVNGSYVETTQDGSSISTVSGIQRTIVTNSRGQSAGYTEKSVPAEVKAVFTHGPTFDVSAYMGSGISIDFACDNGVTYQIADAVFLKDDGLDPSKGTVTVTFSGDAVRL